MLEINKIHCGDCMELMQHIPNKIIDMILCDLPYGITACKWDKVLPLDKLWVQYKRILKNNGVVVLTASQPFTTDLINSNREWFKYCWIWEKNTVSGVLFSKFQPLRVYEEIMVFYENKSIYNPILEDKPNLHIRKNNISFDKKSNVYGFVRRHKRNEFREIPINKNYPKNIIKIKNISSNSKIHPTQKPVELFRYLIKTYTNKENLVLDNCIGSGTTAIACKQLGRKFIGFEISKEYVDIADRRLQQEVLTLK